MPRNKDFRWLSRTSAEKEQIAGKRCASLPCCYFSVESSSAAFAILVTFPIPTVMGDPVCFFRLSRFTLIEVFQESLQLYYELSF